MSKGKLLVIQLEEKKKKLKEYYGERKRLKRSDTKICREQQDRNSKLRRQAREDEEKRLSVNSYFIYKLR